MSELRYLDTAAELDSLLTEPGTLLVNFTASWCGPCKKFSPVLEELADSQPVTIVKVDIDAVEELRDRFTILGVPSTIVFSDGDLAMKFAGAKNRAEVLELLDPLLS